MISVHKKEQNMSELTDSTTTGGVENDWLFINNSKMNCKNNNNGNDNDNYHKN